MNRFYCDYVCNQWLRKFSGTIKFNFCIFCIFTERLIAGISQMKQTLYSAFAQESNGGQVDHQELLKMADKIVKQATSKLHSQVFVNFWCWLNFIIF